MFKSTDFLATFDREEIELSEERQGCSGSSRFWGCWPQKSRRGTGWTSGNSSDSKAVQVVDARRGERVGLGEVDKEHSGHKPKCHVRREALASPAKFPQHCVLLIPPAAISCSGATVHSGGERGKYFF